MMGGMSLINRQPVEEIPRYRIVELVELRRQMLRYSRSVPPGPERNQHRRIELALRRLFKNKKWLDAHAVIPPPAPASLP
jgi:hypothetical protein